MRNKAIFLDRDGVINEVVYHKEMGIVDCPSSVDQFKLLPDVGKVINKFQDLGYIVIIVSNQPGLAKDKYNIDVFNKIIEKMHDELLKDGAEIDFEYYCLHHPNAKIKKYHVKCDCRKPNPGMIFQAKKDHMINLSESWMIGDGINDIQAGKSAGCKTILIGLMKCDICKYLEEQNVKPDFIAPNLYSASLIIEKELRD
jgi:D-glycero-D-manno-heptose 1,7-bisphosphate phosphatase